MYSKQKIELLKYEKYRRIVRLYFIGQLDADIFYDIRKPLWE